MRRSLKVGTASAALIGLFVLAGCTTDPGVTSPSESASAPAAAANEWFDQALFD